MSSMIMQGLRHTVTGDWHTRLSGNTSPRRNHWQTKVTYFRAADELLAALPATPLSWKSIVAAARPYGCRSTFYEVAGSHARHRMVDDLIADGRPDSVQLAWCYLRTDPVEQLLDETKVWSYWPYRQQLLARLQSPSPSQSPSRSLSQSQSQSRSLSMSPSLSLSLSPSLTPEQMAAALTESVLAWARQNEALAASVNHSPPACAVEDLTVIHQGRLAAVRAGAQLCDVLSSAMVAN
ncbi:hypothetical protein GCM10010435_79070 [Winogradskya consettensis]|uniref:Uncharacterized protein n=1 Tax=Winogradskya consettensis TaxID=113560 RepID=A0A919SS97_9ACTN|nr:hypothetical protein [Actinoplanes consettensis]GIM77536.1 hypothetical protein Aco04nite_55890 [Actinoplanes consettensis]